MIRVSSPLGSRGWPELVAAWGGYLADVRLWLIVWAVGLAVAAIAAVVALRRRRKRGRVWTAVELETALRAWIPGQRGPEDSETVDIAELVPAQRAGD